jgi:hypothetical protein
LNRLWKINVSLFFSTKNKPNCLNDDYLDLLLEPTQLPTTTTVDDLILSARALFATLMLPNTHFASSSREPTAPLF